MFDIEPITSDRAGWTDAANAAVRAYCGWHIAPVVTETLRLDGSGSTRLLLPSGHVTAITAATNDGTDVLSKIKWSARGIVQLPTGWCSDEGSVAITLTHGYEHVPDVAGVIAAVAARASTLPHGILAQAVGAASVRYSGDAGVSLLETEKATLAPYRLNWGV